MGWKGLEGRRYGGGNDLFVWRGYTDYDLP